MRLIDVAAEYELPPTPPQKDNWLKDDAKKSLKSDDPHGIGDLSDGSTLGKFVMTTKIFHFMDNTTMHGLRYVFMRNISQARRLVHFKSDFG